MATQKIQFGFSKTITGGHAARSMMFLEMRALVQGMPLVISKSDFPKAVIDDNLLEKPTLSSRKIDFSI